MKNLFENIQTNAKIEYVISEMEILLNEAKKSSPTKDFATQTERIKSLREFQHDFLETVEENRIVNKMYGKIFAQNSQYEIALIELTKERDKLKEENINLKSDIIL